jgi:hypothetical protein
MSDESSIFTLRTTKDIIEQTSYMLFHSTLKNHFTIDERILLVKSWPDRFKKIFNSKNEFQNFYFFTVFCFICNNYTDFSPSEKNYEPKNQEIMTILLCSDCYEKHVS